MNDKLQDILVPGEAILWKGQPKKFCYVLRSFGKLLPTAIVFLLFDGFFIGTMVSANVFSQLWWFFVIFFAIHLIPVWSCIGKIITSTVEHKNIMYAVTDRRVILRSGIVGLDFQSVNYANITNINVDVSVIERLFKVGTIIITTSSGERVCLLSVSDPYGLYSKLNKVFVDMKSDMHYPNAYRPEVNPGYNTKYQS